MPNPNTAFDMLLDVTRENVATAIGNAEALALTDEEMERLAIRMGSILMTGEAWWNAVAKAARDLFDIGPMDSGDARESGD